MKKFAEVEKTRRAYHSAPDRNSVHRAASIFPVIDTARYRTSLAFLNHWKIKRGIPEIGARHTLRDAAGERMGQVFDLLDQGKAYDIRLEEIGARMGLDTLPEAGSWEVEYFSARNMFIPYPAVVMNTWNDGFFNQVHAYARVLNDFDENAAVNEAAVREASIDVLLDAEHDTFVEVLNGPYPAEAEIEFTMQDQAGRTTDRHAPFRAAPYGKARYSLSEMFPGDAGATNRDRTFLMRQPAMGMFFSRVWGGIAKRDGSAFAANHSYYDNSSTTEYWEIDPANEAHSSKVFPLFDDLELTLRLYPIACAADLDFHVALYDGEGNVLRILRDVAAVRSGSAAIVEFPLSRLGREEGAAAAELFVTPAGRTRVPMRIALQVCYGTGSGLDSSINISLLSPYVFWPEGKPGRTWCAVSGEAEIDNRIALYHTAPVPDRAPHPTAVTLYRDADEKTLTARLDLEGKQSWGAELEALLPGYKNFLGGRAGYLYAESDCQFLRCLSIQTNRRTGHTSGEHGF